MSIWAGTRGFLDKIATKEILRFEELWLAHVKTTEAWILEEISTKKSISDETEEALRATMDEFAGAHGNLRSAMIGGHHVVRFSSSHICSGTNAQFSRHSS